MIFRSVARLLTAALLILLPSRLSAAITPSNLEMLTIQEGGRKKPYLVFSEETLRSLSGKTTLSIDGGRMDAMTLMTGIWMNPAAPWKEKPMILVSNRPLRLEVGLDPERKLFSYDELTANEALLRDIAAAAETRRRDPRAKLVGLQKEASDVGMRLGLFESLLNGEAFRVIPPLSGTDWLSIPASGSEKASALFSEMQRDWKAPLQFEDESSRLITLQESVGGIPPKWKTRLEVLYQKAHLFRWAWILYAAAGIVLLLSRSSWEGLGYRFAWLLAGSGFFLQAAGLASRVLIGGRPPVTNMYESVIWVSFGTILFALIFEAIYGAGFFLLGAVPVAVASLILADSQPMILDRSIHPLVPVLRDNFWLTTHVLTITLSYAAFALSLGVAHVALARIIAGRKPSAALYNYLYKTLQVGVLLLATGTILGGVWANYSWGRFWDWDPKETWALTALLGYLFLLHGRISGLWGGFGLAIGAVLAFQSVLMAWYGVNFVLGAGLHSYGFGTGGFPLVAAFVGFELLLLLAAIVKKKNGPNSSAQTMP
jgi:ABC-type transport system involved in cytochrome c biogenesis permease subunit